MYIIVFITVKDKAEAEHIAGYLVKEKLAACVNVILGVNSLFWWEGKIDKAEEVLLVVKTKEKLFEKLERGVKSIHSYDVPEIIAFPIVKGNKDYLKWIDQSVSK